MGLEIAGQVVVLEQNAILEHLVPALDLAFVSAAAGKAFSAFRRSDAAVRSETTTSASEVPPYVWLCRAANGRLCAIRLAPRYPCRS